MIKPVVSILPKYERKQYPDYIRSWRLDHKQQPNNFNQPMKEDHSAYMSQQMKKSINRYNSQERQSKHLGIIETKEQKIEQDIKKIDKLYEGIQKKVIAKKRF